MKCLADGWDLRLILDRKCATTSSRATEKLFNAIYSRWCANRFRTRKRIREDEPCRIRRGNRGPTWVQSETTSDFIDNGDLEILNCNAYSNAFVGLEQRMPEVDNYNANTFDKYLWWAETLLSLGHSMLQASVVKTWKTDADGNLIGKANSNPLLDTRLYKMEFLDGNIQEYAANVAIICCWSPVSTMPKRTQPYPDEQWLHCLKR